MFRSPKTFMVFCVFQAACYVQAQFTVEPVSVVQAEGLEAVFVCLYPGASDHTWGINGSFPKSNAFPTNVSRYSPSGGSPARLVIPAISHYNNTVVQCRAVVDKHGVPMYQLSKNATLLVQDISINVNKSTDTITLSWNSEDLTTNITYCVEVSRVTLGSQGTMLTASMCNLTGPEYIFPSPGHSVCDRFSFTVTPTEGDLRGTPSEPVTGFFTQVTVFNGSGFVSGPDINGTKKVTIEIDPCYGATHAELMSTDNLLLLNSRLTFYLPSDNHENVVIFLNNGDGIEFQLNVSVSTYDVQGIHLTAQTGNYIVIVDFVNNSTAPGALLVYIPTSQNVYVQYMMVSRDNPSTSFMPNSDGIIMVYDLEPDTFLRQPTTTAAVIKPITRISDLSPPSHPCETGAIMVTESGDGRVTAVSRESGQFLLVLRPHDSLKPLAVGSIGEGPNGESIVDIAISMKYSAVVFTWTLGGSLSDARVSEVQIKPKAKDVDKLNTGLAVPACLILVVYLLVAVVYVRWRITSL